MRCKSTFPPDITATTFSLLYNYQLFLQSAAVANAPAPSTTAFHVVINLSSLLPALFLIQLQYHLLILFTISNVNSPGILTAQPSAIVGAS